MEKNCPCQGSTLSKFVQPVILSILSKKRTGGYRIIREMETYPTFDGGAPDPTGIYRYLHAMEEKGLIEKAGEDENGVYGLTAAGAECLRHWKQTLTKYRAQLDNLIEEL